MAPPHLTLKDIRLTFGGTPLLEGAEIAVAPGDRIALVGRNGSGKSTLLRIAAGLVLPDSGERFMHPNASVRYLAQEADFTGFETARAYVEAGLGPADDPHRALLLLSALGLSGEERCAQLSGGEARRAALARVVAAAPDVLLLDEPTNHLDLPAILWLEAELQRTRSALVLISHDRRFLETVARTTVWLDRGVTRRLEQGFGAFEAWRDGVIEKEEADRHKLERKIVREDQWMHGGVTARRKRNVRRVRELRQLRADLKSERRAEGNVVLAAAEAQQSGRLVADMQSVAKSFGGAPIVRNLSLRILRGDRVGIVGPNGAGKTTILKLLTGVLEPDQGSIRLGTGLELVSLDQRRDELNPEWTVAEALTGGRGDQVVIAGRPRHVASYMKDFLFKPEQTRSPVSVLSGGERARLMLARALAKPSNVLVLDEPTNDLDLETLDLLQELLAEYPGTVLLVSHDRDFLDRVVTSVLAAEGDGRWTEYAGGYADMLAQRQGADLDKPQRKEAARSPVAKSAEAAAEAGLEAAPAPAPAGRRKLSFKEKHQLETLPRLITDLESEIAALGERLADPGLYGREPETFGALSTRLADAQRGLADAEEQWLTLEMLRAEIEG